jgi:hypothetical protein
MSTALISSSRRPHRLVLWASALVLGAAVMTAQSAEAPQFSTDISIDEIMEAIVMPTADAIWKAVQVDLTAAGEVKTAPSSEEAWLALRHQAVTLASVTNLLMIPNLKIAKDPNSKKHGEGELPPVEIGKLHKAQMAAFAGHAKALHATAMKAIAAIDKRDLDGISDVGGEMDAVCEACHTQFWYPNQGK